MKTMMTLQIDPTKKIIVDADVIIHFIKGEQLGILTSVFPNELYLLDYVFKEVFFGQSKTQVENLIRYKRIQELKFDGDINVVTEFAKLKRRFGPGESACMAYCRYHKDILASSNLKDIKTYCQEHGIQYLTTMDFLYEAFCKNLLNEMECDTFISMVLSKRSKLPFQSMRDYLLSLR